MKNEKIKMFFAFISAFVLGAISAISAIVLHNRGTTSDTRERISDAERTTRELEASTERSSEILEEIRKQKL